jgi:hypothetical protein
MTTPEQVRRAAEEVFARPEFSPDAGVPNWLIRAFTEFFRWLGQLPTVNPVMFWFLLSSCVLLLLLLLIYAIASLGFGFEFGGRAARRRAAVAAAERRRRSAEYRAEAGRAAERSDFTEAIRCLFLSLVFRLDEQGRVGFQKARTNREYLSLLDAVPPVRRELGVFVDTLDDHWYGQRPAGRERFEDCQARYDRMLAAV